jgi:CheY-like chemotaxis protein
MEAFILIVDDDRIVREMGADILKEAGYPVLEAAHTIEAILLLEKHPSVTLLFTDINMPGANGYVLADMAVMRRPDLRVLYTTGGALVTHSAEGQPGFLHGEVLAKPYRPGQLTAAVAESLARPRPVGRWMRATPEPVLASA